MSAYDAQRQFEDNVRLLPEDLEKQNLYRGLGNLASELQRITAALQRIETALRSR
jgi:hypothetical protein